MAVKDSNKNTLEMVFNSSIPGKTITLSIITPKTTLTKSEVQTAMQNIIAKEVFAINGGLLESVKDFYYRQLNIQTLS